MKNFRTLTLVLILLAGVGLGCSAINKLRSGIEDKPANTTGVDSNANSAVADPEPTSSTATANPKADLEAAVKRFTTLEHFIAHTATEPAADLSMTMEYAAPDRYRIKSAPVHGTSTEMIIIGKDFWIKLGSTWIKSSAIGAATIEPYRKMIAGEGLRKLEDVKYVGTDTVDGKSADKYTYVNPGTPSAEVPPFSSTVWVNKATSLPMKISASYASGQLKGVTITYDTDTPVKIEKPI